MAAGIARLDELLGLSRQRDDIVPDDADADVMKVIVRKQCDVSLGLRQRMAFIAAGTGVEEIPAAHGRIIDSVLVTGDEAIKGRIE